MTEGQTASASRVLVVDDEANLRFAIERGLKKAGHVADAAASVGQALERLRADPYDIVISDLRMPGGSGTELIKWLGAHSPSTKVVVVSAFVTNEFRENFRSKQLRILEKPVEFDKLLETVEELGPRKGFFGNAIEVELFDYVQMVALSGRDKLIEIKTPASSGLVWFEHGDICHVEYGEQTGEKAFYRLVAEGRGSFSERLFSDPPKRTIIGSSMHLLMEAARQMDEGTLGQDGDEASTEDGATSAPDEDEDETSFGDLGDDDDDEPLPATASMIEPVEDDFALPVDDDEESPAPPSVPPLPKTAPPPPPTGLSGRPATAPQRSVPSATSSPSTASSAPNRPGGQPNLLDDPETRELMLGQFFQFEGVNGVAIISSTGKVLAEDMRSNSSLVTLAGFYMRGAARIARDLGYNVFDGVIAKSVAGQQLLMVSMGATSAVLSVEIGCDPEEIRKEVMGVDA